MAIKIKQYKSKYPFNQGVQPEGTLYAGHVDNIPEELHYTLNGKGLQQGTKFIIIYEDVN